MRWAAVLGRNGGTLDTGTGTSLSARERDEPSLLHGAVVGEPDAVKVLLDVYMPTVYGFVLARVGGRTHVAEDIVQETAEEVIRSADTFRGDASLGTWLCAIARRRLARYYERERKAEEANRVLSIADDIVDLNTDERDHVFRALRSLPVSQRQALILKYMDDLPVTKVAEEMGRTPVQVQSLLQRGRVALKTALQ